MKHTFASLKYFNYRIWFAAALVANIGTWMQRVAQDWVVLTDLSTGVLEAGTAVGIVTALQFVPTLLLSPYAGVLADRLPRRGMLIATQAASGVLAIALGVLILSGKAELWHIFCFAFGLGIVSALDGPVRQTFVAELVPMEKLPNAVGLNSASFNAARLVGPGLAGLLIAAFGAGWMFIANGVSFGATIIAMIFLRTAELYPVPSAPREKGQIRAGLRYIRRRSDIVVIMIVVGVVSAFGLNFQITSGLMATQVFNKGAGEYGVLGSILAIGSLSGALLAARRDRPRVRLVIGSAAAFGISAGAMALMPTYWTFAAMSIAVGFSSLTMMTAANSTIQMSTDPRLRGRVMAIYMMVFLGATPIGAPIIGWIGSTFGARWSIGVGAISSLLVALIAGIWAWRTWHVRVHYHLRSRPHLSVLNPVSSDVELMEPSEIPEGIEAPETVAVKLDASDVGIATKTIDTGSKQTADLDAPRDGATLAEPEPNGGKPSGESNEKPDVASAAPTLTATGSTGRGARRTGGPAGRRKREKAPAGRAAKN